MPRFTHSAFLIMSLSLAFPVMASEGVDIESFNAAYTAYKTYAQNKDYERAVPEAKSAYEIGRELFGEISKELPMLAFNYGAMLAAAGENTAAEEIFQQALMMYEYLYGNDAVELIPTLMQLGKVAGQKDDTRKKTATY